jgi:aryl-alcohol dehydrogenase-like predicted oxidoreductase
MQLICRPQFMDYRFLGASGFKVSALGFGAGTFGGKGPLFNAWGTTDVAQARRLLACSGGQSSALAA